MADKETPFTDSLSHIAAMVQADATGQPEPTSGTDSARQDTAANPPPAAIPPSTPQDGGSTPPAPGTYGGQYKTEEEAIKARHLLIHNSKAALARAEKAEAELAAARAQSALSPGRVDPAAGARPGPNDEKWFQTYGIDPADVDARVARIVEDRLEAERAPQRALQAADAYIVSQYPDFPVKGEEIKIFVAANEPLRDRVSDLWSKGLFKEAMEIGYLAYDNAVRTVEKATEAGKKTAEAIDGNRADATILQNQASGPRETVRDPNDQYPRTDAEWDAIRKLQITHPDRANRILYGHLIKDIPELNPR